MCNGYKDEWGLGLSSEREHCAREIKGLDRKDDPDTVKQYPGQLGEGGLSSITCCKQKMGELDKAINVTCLEDSKYVSLAGQSFKLQVLLSKVVSPHFRHHSML